MTQTSRPTGQHTDNYPFGDSGPYSSLQYRTVYKEIFTSDDDEGPVGGYLNELEVTNPIGKTIRVNTGMAIVGGNFFFNDANVDFSPPNPAGAARYDYVVACLNDTDATFATSDAGHTLAFPTDLTDYNSAASIQEYTCRLVIVRGAEGGGLPTLDQNDDHYMVPLASYLITTAGVVSSLTDRRELLRRRSFFVPALCGYNVTDGTVISLDVMNPTAINRWEPAAGIPLAANKECWGAGEFAVPQDAAGYYSVRAVVIAEGTGNVYGANYMVHNACGTAAYTIDSASAAAEAVGLPRACLREMTGTWTTTHRGQVGRLEFNRDATDPLDTVGAGDEVFLTGWIVIYSARP